MHSADLDLLLTSKTMKFFFFDKSGAAHEFISEEDMEHTLV